MVKVGLIGEKLGHSFSKTIHEQIEDYTYEIMPLTRHEFPLFMEKRDFDAINVTIPYKEMVIPYCDFIDEKAMEIGAVNAIKNVNGKLYATNTDYDGLKWMIENHFDIKGKTVAICGSGGTSKTAFAVCKDLGAKTIVRVARGDKGSDYINYKELQDMKDVEFILNTTSVGMFPDIMSAIVDLDDFPKCQGVIDVVYNPLLTSLCYQAKMKNIPYICGLEMLVGQAISAVEFFTGKKLDRSIIKSIVDQLYRNKQNIVFIGFSDSDKSSLGKQFADTLDMDFVDMDEYLDARLGKTNLKILEKDLEKMKDEICNEFAKRNHTVINCSADIVKKQHNMQALSLNGLIIYVNEQITEDGSFLSSNRDSINKTKQELMLLFEKYSDIIIENNGNFNNTFDKLVEVFHEYTYN